MVDSNFANPVVNRPNPSQPRITPDASTKTTPSFCHFCWGTALGLVVGAFCGAFLPDQIINSGAAPSAAFGPVAAPSLAKSSVNQSQDQTPDWTQSTASQDILAEVPHAPDAE